MEKALHTDSLYVPAPQEIVETDLLPLIPKEMRDEFGAGECRLVAADVNRCLYPRLVYRVYPEFVVAAGGVRIGRSTLGVGPKNVSVLRRCVQVAVCIGTVGAEVTALHKRYDAEGHPLRAYLCDGAANVALDRLMLRWRTECLPGHATYPICPGCCQWDIAEQQLLFSLVEARSVGVSLSASGLMRPIKSISAVVGISPTERFATAECDVCGRKNCIYRELRNVALK